MITTHHYNNFHLYDDVSNKTFIVKKSSTKEIPIIKEIIFTPDIALHEIISSISDEHINIINITYNKNVNNTKIKNNLDVSKLTYNSIIIVLDDIIDRLIFDFNFNRKVFIISNSIKELVFGNTFNQDIGYLPDTIETLILGNSFNKKINYLPKKLKNLAIYHEFNHTFDNDVLMDTIENISLNNTINKTINKYPNNLTRLKIGRCDGDDLINFESLKYLEVEYFTNNQNHFPKNLLSLCCNLKSTVNYINISRARHLKSCYIEFDYTCSKIILPNSVIYLKIKNEASNKTFLLNNLPQALEILYATMKKNDRMNNLPNKLTYIKDSSNWSNNDTLHIKTKNYYYLPNSMTNICYESRIDCYDRRKKWPSNRQQPPPNPPPIINPIQYKRVG